jgi:AbrB family looped-hinge helix DNA binding protein
MRLALLWVHTYLFTPKEHAMNDILELESTVSSKGQITLPAALRAKLGLVEGSKVKFVYDGETTLLQAEKPVSYYRGFLKEELRGINTDMPKEPDRF